ncbi:MAG: hypothetical protein Kow0092_28930 [Deferrisomatales bacterium]
MNQPQTSPGRRRLAAVASGATAALLFASSLFAAPVGFALCLLSPLPVALTAWRFGPWAASLAAGAGALVAGVLAGPLGAAVFASQFAAGGAVLGLAVRAGRSPEVAVGGYAVLSIGAFWATLGALSLGAPGGPLTVLDQALHQSVEQVSALLAQGNADPQAALALQQWADHTRQVLGRTFPGLLAALSVLCGWANAVLLRRLSGVARLTPWNRWRAPEGWIWILIGAGLAGFLAPGSLGAAGVNVFLVASAIYFLQGLAIVQYLFEARGFPRVFRAVAYALLFVQFPVMLLVAGLGAFDLWVDFRTRWAPAPPAHG